MCYCDGKHLRLSITGVRPFMYFSVWRSILVMGGCSLLCVVLCGCIQLRVDTLVDA
jgi:hypothetical protein